MSTQQNLFEEIITAAKSSGFGFISDKPVSRATLSVSRAYLLSSLFILSLSYMLVLSIFGELSENVLPNIPLLNMNTYALVLIVFYIVNQERIVKNFLSFLELKEEFCWHTEQDKTFFYEILEKYSKLVNGFVRYMFWYNLLMISADILVKILCRTQIIDINGKNYLLHEVSFNATSKEVFWPTFIIQASSLHLVVVTQMFNDLFVINMTVFQVVSFVGLRFKLEGILLPNKNTLCTSNKLEERRNSENSFCEPNKFKETRTRSLSNPLALSINKNYFPMQNEYVGPKVKQWVAFHSQLLRLCNEFNQLYHPVLLAYLVNKFVNVCFGMFMITQGKGDFFNGFETIVIISYFLMNAVCLLALCVAGTHLTLEVIESLYIELAVARPWYGICFPMKAMESVSTGVFDDAFHSPWYQCLPATKKHLSIIASMAKKPVRLSVLCSETAEMSIDTFIWIFRAIITYYITLTRFKQQLFNNGNNIGK